MATFYSFSTLMITYFSDEALHDRKVSERTAKPEGVLGRIKLLTGVAGLGASGRPTISTVIKDLIAISCLPCLIVPSPSSLYCICGQSGFQPPSPNSLNRRPISSVTQRHPFSTLFPCLMSLLQNCGVMSSMTSYENLSSAETMGT